MEDDLRAMGDERAAGNEPDAKAQEQQRAALTRFATRYLGNLDDAEDAVQEVFVKMLESDCEPRNLRAWSYRIARNVCLNRLRAKGRRRDADRLATGVDVPMEELGQLTRLMNREEGQQVLGALDDLSEAQREVLVLRYLDGLDRAEIATVLDVSVAVVKSRLYEGVSRMRR